MAAPELVVANAAYKRYPGGVIALRATDWVGPARGTLSTEVDALAGNGEVVRDSQQVDGILADESAAYDAALDTLVIPLSGIPIENGLSYSVFASYRVEGEWDLNDGPVLRESDNLVFNYVAAIGAHGTAYETESGTFPSTRVLARIPYYAMTLFSFLTEVDSTQTIRIRAFSESGSTAEWLIDQLVFLPEPDYVSWLEDDYARIATTNSLSLDNPPSDGADGGDDNGKFTLQLSPSKDDSMLGSPLNSAGDYQQKASAAAAEYLLRVAASDGYKIVNTAVTPEAESATYAYSLHCVRNRGQIVWVDDTFDNRTTSPDDWGLTPEGYGYRLGQSAAANDPHLFVSGGVGVIRLRQNLTQGTVGLGEDAGTGELVGNQGGRLTGDDQWEFSGVCEHTAGILSAGRWRIFCFSTNGALLFSWEIRIDVAAKTWQLGAETGGVFTNLGSTHDISSWFGLGAPLGWRIEVKRYDLRVRVWDASGAEPGTWDEEVFVPVRVAGVLTAYPYGDDEVKSQQAYTSMTPFAVQIESTGNSGNTFPYDVSFHSMKFEHNPYGGTGDMTVSMERPEGSSIGEITVPYGCAYFVYWGTRDWTDLVGGNPAYVAFSSKVWNEVGSAEIQWADAPFWWFRSIHEFIIPMNWRSSTREGGHKRILKGDT